MKFNVGYQQKDGFADLIADRADRIGEVYFSYGTFPNGRARADLDPGGRAAPWERQQRQMEELARFSDRGIGLDLLLNAACYGRDSQSRAFFERIGDTVELLSRRLKLTAVTTTSPLIGKFIKANFPELTSRASVNMEIGTVEGMRYVSPFFDSFYMKRDCNRDLRRIRELTGWCRENGKELLMLANSGCLNNCSAHTFHDNLVAHEAEIAGMDNAYQFEGVCRDFLRDPANLADYLMLTNFVRPEDVRLYEPYFPAVKLATRVNRAPARVLRAYLEGRYTGSVMDLLEPDHGGVILPRYPENSKFPPEFGERVLNCPKNCGECGWCREVFSRVLTDLGESFYIGGSRDGE